MHSPTVRFAIILLYPILISAQSVSFQPPIDAVDLGGGVHATSFRPGGLASGDFNGDGKPDLATLTGNFLSYGISVALGNGDGTFRPANSVAAYGAGLPAEASGGIALGDFNTDGKLDIAIYESIGFTIYPGRGDGTFGSPIRTAVPTPSDPTVRLLTGDFNRDGKPDLVYGNLVLLGNGDGTFRLASSLAGNATIVGDFNGDGAPDLFVVLTTAQQFGVALGHGDGTFGTPLTFSPLASCGSFLAGDFNGDGKLDVAMGPASTDTPQNPVVVVRLGNGDGTFAPQDLITGPFAPQTPSFLEAAGDLNRDGKLDLVIGNGVLLVKGDGTFRGPLLFGVMDAINGSASLSAPLPAEALIADFNGDGWPDIASAYTPANYTNLAWTAHVALLLNRVTGDGFLSTGLSAASGTYPVAPGSIVTMFGSNLALTTEAASSRPLPTTLGGIRVHVRYRAAYSDSSDRVAQLLYVSPTQINFLMPPDAPVNPTSLNPSDTIGFHPGFLYVSLERVGQPFAPDATIVPLTSFAPGLFTYIGNLPAATAIQVGDNGVQTSLPLYACEFLFCREQPIDLSQGQVYLSLYGTGFTAGADRADLVCHVNGQALTPLYAGPQGQTPGLDQINLLLPSNLASGNALLSCEHAGGVLAAVSNDVMLVIK